MDRLGKREQNEECKSECVSPYDRGVVLKLNYYCIIILQGVVLVRPRKLTRN